MLLNVFIHMVLEGIGGAVTLYARGFCTHRRHQFTIWFVFALFFSFITVSLIG